MQINLAGVLVDGSAVTVSPARTDINVYQGVDTVIQVSVTNSAATIADLTSYTALLTIKDRVLPTAGTPSVSKTYTATISAPTTGVMKFSIPGSDLKALSLVGYWYDVMVTSGASKRDEVVPTGTMTVNLAAGA